MGIYIEFAIIDNMVINYMLLYLTNLIFNYKSKKLLIFLSSIIGTTCSIFSPFLNNTLNNVLKLILVILMPLFLIKKPTLKKILLTSFTFFILTILFMGLCIFVGYNFNISFIYNQTGQIYYNFPIGLILFICISIFICIKNLINIIYNKKHTANFLYNVLLSNSNTSYKTNAFLDSGNFLCDNCHNPINLININAFKKLYPEINMANILLKKVDNLPLKNPKYLKVGGIGKSKEILVFEIEKMQIQEDKGGTKTLNNALLGLSLKDFQENLDAECILNYKIFS